MKRSKNKLNIIGFKEFREKSEMYISRIEKGASFMVLRKSKPIFRLTPVEDEDMWEPIADFTKIHPDGISALDAIKALRRIHG